MRNESSPEVNLFDKAMSKAVTIISVEPRIAKKNLHVFFALGSRSKTT
jgi:hypothetical protein